MFDLNDAVANNVVITTHSDEAIEKIDELLGNDFNFDKIIKTPTNIEKRYTWRKENWGTAHLAAYVRRYRFNRSLRYYFETEFQPPTLVLIALSKMFPSAEIKLDYHGTSWPLLGNCTIKAGKVLDHDETCQEDMYNY